MADHPRPPVVFFAHSREDAPEAEWHVLSDHLTSVAALSKGFAAKFGASDYGHLAGLWHDLGKFQPEFQRRLRGERIAAPHAWIGATHAMQRSRHEGHIIAFPIVGHHAGMPDRADLSQCVKSARDPLVAVSFAPNTLIDPQFPALPDEMTPGRNMPRDELRTLTLRHELWIRFLFSALVDADFLDTEAFYKPGISTIRGQFDAIPSLCARLDSYIDGVISALPITERESTVNQARASVLGNCRNAADSPPGTFSLTVPTGGGKTLSAMSFALRHAERHGLDRVITVIPYTSIIEQNADVYRRALGNENVIEHHSNLDPEKEKNGDETSYRHRLASENWDAPIVVTTTVQFFESLFSNRPSRCRKLHNIARSVIILDEVQTLPPGFLASIVDVLNELVKTFGCTIVLSTATPPALSARENFPDGLRGVREIVADPVELARGLRRVEYSWPSASGAVEWAELAEGIATHEQVLAIVHRRADARTLAEEVANKVNRETVLHLSALMCPAHRREVLADVHRRLRSQKPCRLVSTQLVEAGVDVDFPAVYRALGGLDSIVQAAGRCNREGRFEVGHVKVFQAPTAPPPGVLRAAFDVTKSMLNNPNGAIDPNDPAIFEKYFMQLYFTQNLDAKHIQREREHFDFSTTADLFRIIEDGFTKTVIVPYDERAVKAIEALRNDGISRDSMRALQPFSVSIYPQTFKQLHERGALVPISDELPDLYTLTTPFEHVYDRKYGLLARDELFANPAVLIG